VGVAPPADRDALRCDAWLVLDGRVLASAQLATGRVERRRGLLGRDHVDGVLVLSCRWVHTVGMRMPIDVAHCDADGVVLSVTTMAPGRVGRPCPRARQVVEASAGAFAAWGVRPGMRVELRR
jgi:uncharacterized membrane protein (UPF0127 family)